jgi:SAM-dependent methyltransferase
MDATTRKPDDLLPDENSTWQCWTTHLKRRTILLGNPTEATLSRAGVERASRVLELGCGVSDVSLRIAKLVGPTGLVVGVDESAERIDVAEKRATVAGQCYWARFVAADPNTFIPDDRFDVTLLLGREHATLLRLSSWVRPDGVIMIMAGTRLDCTIVRASTDNSALPITTFLASSPNQSLQEREVTPSHLINRPPLEASAAAEG